jgi:DNA recombination protein Rad52
MSGFSAAQLRKLSAKLDRSHVQSRSVDGNQVDYIEGWFALSEANAIFGFSNWDRETVHFERLFERTRGDTTTCSYLARVRIAVRSGGSTTVREGSGCGTASAPNAGDAHERAIKAAETDATKRALATFGNRFGLCLYDKEKNGVTERVPSSLEILQPDGKPFATNLSPEGFCSGVRQIVEITADRVELDAWRNRNRPQIARLRKIAPDLRTQRGEHYADVLERLFRGKLAAPQHELPKVGSDTSSPANNISGTSDVPALPEVSSDLNPLRCAETAQSSIQPLAPSRIALGPRIDKASLAIKTARRLRDKAHLRHVGTLPCLICKSAPSHAHHLTFAQPRGLALKVSDEFVVPLCAFHHNDLHQSGSEIRWWKQARIEPLVVASKLWSMRGEARREQHEARTAVHSYPAASA